MNVEVTNGPFYVYGDDGSNSPNSIGYYYPLYTTNSPGSLTQIDITITDSSDQADASQTTFYYDASSNPAASLGTATKPTNIPLFLSTSSEDYFTVASEFSAGSGKSLLNGKLYPDLWVSGTIDTVIDHLCTTRFGRGNLSAISFRNETVINSSLIFCRAAPSQLNYSSNPTYKDSDGNIVALNSNDEPFSFVTTVGLYDADRFLLAVAKTSRPIEKNPETDLSIRIRLDY